MANNVNTSFQVSFGIDSASAAGANAHLSAEVDARANGLNAGPDGARTSFVPGDTVGFLVYKSNNVSITVGPTPSAGSVASAGNVTVQKDVEVSFANETEARLPVPATAINNVKWLGNSLGALTLGAGGTSVTAGAQGVAVAKITITAPALAYTLSSPASLAGETDYSILVYIEGSIAT